MNYYIYYPTVNFWGRVYKMGYNLMDHIVVSSLKQATIFPDRESAETSIYGSKNPFGLSFTVLDQDTVNIISIMDS